MSLKVRQALTQSFIDGGFGLPVAHENISFTPQSGVPYVAIYVADNDVTPFDLSHTNETDGVFRVLLFYPQNGGAILAANKSEEILKHFAIGSKHEYDGQLVAVRSYSQSPGEADAGWYKLVLTIRYKAYLKRFNH